MKFKKINGFKPNLHAIEVVNARITELTQIFGGVDPDSLGHYKWLIETDEGICFQVDAVNLLGAKHALLPCAISAETPEQAREIKKAIESKINKNILPNLLIGGSVFILIIYFLVKLLF